MHRVRQSVGYFEALGWKPTVMVVEPRYTEGVVDELLDKTLPEGLDVVAVKAYSTKWTRKVGLGSLALRALWFYFKTGNRLLAQKKFDLIYFSTTMFPVMILGAYWKKRFGIPYVIDMQDPWFSDHYLNLPPAQRPAKFWFSYRLNKYLEPLAMKDVDGIISVSQGYCDTLQRRYPCITPANCTVIPFGAFPKDFEVLDIYQGRNRFFGEEAGTIPVVYVGRGGHDMHKAATLIFKAFQLGLHRAPAVFGKVRLHFIGTSYAPAGKGQATLKPIADAEGVGAYVTEYPARVPYFEALHLLRAASMLLVPGSVDPNYTASKLYPYIMAQRPLLAVFNQRSSVIKIMRETKAGEYLVFDEKLEDDRLPGQLCEKWLAILTRLPFRPDTDWEAFRPYTAGKMAEKQVQFFEKILGEASSPALAADQHHPFPDLAKSTIL